VIGFVVSFSDPTLSPIYVTGDTVWFDGVAEVARRFRPGIVLLFAGSAQVRGPFHLTMDTNPTCAESMPLNRQINALAEKSSLHFCGGILIRRWRAQVPPLRKGACAWAG
jgi:hypothetical protein